ncbi:MAG: hypothetical protein R3F56_11910 [Planctomycetota bacterium]
MAPCVSWPDVMDVDGSGRRVTWLFSTGPRQTISREGCFAPGSAIESHVVAHRAMSNRNAARDTVTDVNEVRSVRGGSGFTPQALATIGARLTAADVPDRGRAFDQGPRLGVPIALGFVTGWAESLRVLNCSLPLDATAVARGRNLFTQTCLAWHGGSKWTARLGCATSSGGRSRHPRPTCG